MREFDVVDLKKVDCEKCGEEVADLTQRNRGREQGMMEANGGNGRKRIYWGCREALGSALID